MNEKYFAARSTLTFTKMIQDRFPHGIHGENSVANKTISTGRSVPSGWRPKVDS